jgi:collagen type III alpha
MATSPDQVHGHQYVDFDEYIDIQLRKASSTIKTTDVMTAVVGVLTLVTLYLLLFVICDHWLVPGGFGPTTRSLMLALVGSIACVWIALKVIVPWRRRVSGLYAASTIEKASPALKSSLINLVDISRSGHEVSPEIYQSIERRAALALTHVDVNEAVDRRSLLRLSNALLAVVVLFCLYWIFSPKNPGTSLWRAMVPSASVGVATRTEIFNVHPGDKDVLARTQLEVTADIRGEIPPQSFLYFTTADRKFVDERVEMRQENEGTRKFRCVLTGDNGGGLLQNMTYRIVAGDATTPEYKIRVIQPPAATIDSIRLESPEYTRREPVTQATGAIDALEGTKVTLKAHANMPLRSPALLQFFDDETASKRAEEYTINVTDGTKLQVDWKLEIRSDGTYPHYYRIYCTNTEGESDPSPSLYNYSIRPDQPPEIILRDPKTDLDLPSNAVLPLAIEARDPDFALTYIDLNIEKDGSPVVPQLIYNGSDQQFKATYHWQLKDLQLRPKDTITYWLQAKDNRQPVANVSRTPKLRIHVIEPVSEEQAQKNLAAMEKRQQDEAQKNAAEQSPQEKENPGDDNSGEKPEKKPQPKQPKDRRQADGHKRDKSNQAHGKPDEQPADGQENNQQQPDKPNEQANQAANNAPDQDDPKNQKLNPDNPADEAKAITKFDDLLNPKPKKPRPSLSPGAGGGDENQPGQNQPNPNNSASDKPDPNSQQKPNRQQSGSSPSSGQNGPKKPDQVEPQPNPSAESKPEGQPNGNDKPGESGNEKRDQKDAKGQNPTPGTNQPDAQGTKPGDKPQGDKPGEQPNGAKPGEKPQGNQPGDSKRSQPEGKSPQPQPQPGDQPQQRGDHPNGSSEGSPEAKDPKAKKDATGNQSSTTDNPAGKSGDKPEQHKQPGEGNSQDKTGEKPDPTKSNSGKPDTKPEGKPDTKADGKPDSKPSPNNQGDNSDSGNNNNNNNQKNSEGGQTKNGDQPAGNQTGNDPSKKEGASQSQNSEGNSGDNSPNRNSGEKSGQKPSGKPDDSNPSGGQREKASNDPSKKESGKEPGDNSSEQGDASKKEPGDHTGQAPRKSSEGDQQRQPNGGQAGKPNGDRKPQEQSDNNDPASGQESKTAKQRQNDRRQGNPVDAKRPESDHRPLDEQPNSVPNKKNRTGTAGSETDPSHASQEQGTPQEGKTQQGKTEQGKTQPGKTQQETADPRGRQQETDTKAGGKQERGAQQKQNGSPEKEGSSEQPGGKDSSSGQNGTPKSGDPKDGQPQADPSQPGQSPSGKGQAGKGQEGKGQGKEGQPGSKGDPKEGTSGSGQDGKGGQPSPAGKPGSKPSPGTGQSNAGANGGGINTGNGPGAGAPLEESQANLDYAKKATNLVLDRLEGQLKRGKIDKKIEEEMGWDKDQVRRFVERMRKEAQAAEDPNAPGSEARRAQFEETLRAMGGPSATRRHSNQSLPKSNDNEIGGTRSQAPPEYRDLYEAYTRSLAKPVPRQTDEKK